MADDEIMDEMDEGAEVEADDFEIEVEVDDVDPEELEAEIDDDLADDDEAFVVADDDFADDDEDDEDTAGPVRRSVPATVSEDEDEDEDLLAPDDVEADLDTILKDRLVSAEEANEDEEDDEPEDRSESGDRLQPKRADEQLCSSCFLLVRQGAPVCPVGDDDCPIFS
jgi:hypothetical protein